MAPDNRCYAFRVCYDIYEPHESWNELCPLIDGAAMQLPGVEVVISNRVELVADSRAAYSGATVVSYTERAGFTKRYNSFLEAATKALEGKAVIHAAQEHRVAVTQTEARALKDAASSVDSLNMNAAQVSAAADAQEAAAAPDEPWEGYVYQYNFIPKGDAWEGTAAYSPDPLGWRKYAFPVNIENFSKELQRCLKKRREVRDVAIVPFDGAFRDGLGASLQIFVKTDSASEKDWWAIYSYLAQNHLYDGEHWYSLVAKLQEGDSWLARVVKRNSGIAIDWPMVSHVHIRGLRARAFQHDASENDRKKLRLAMLVAAAECRIADTDGEQQALVVYSPRTQLGMQVVTGLATEVEWLKYSIQELQLKNQKARKQLYGNNTMEEVAIVPYVHDDALTVIDHFRNVQTLRSELRQQQQEARELLIKLEADSKRDRFAVSQEVWDG